ncbi:hypothetical protein EGW08_020497, partial [Elysia chlorotica]
ALFPLLTRSQTGPNRLGSRRPTTISISSQVHGTPGHLPTEHAQSRFEALFLASPQPEPEGKHLAEIFVDEAVQERVDGGVGEQDPERRVLGPGGRHDELMAQAGQGPGRPAQDGDHQQQRQEPRSLGVLFVQEVLRQVSDGCPSVVDPAAVAERIREVAPAAALVVGGKEAVLKRHAPFER